MYRRTGEQAEQTEIANAAAVVAAAKEAEQVLARAEAEREAGIGSIEPTTSQLPDPTPVLNTGDNNGEYSDEKDKDKEYGIRGNTK